MGFPALDEIPSEERTAAGLQRLHADWTMHQTAMQVDWTSCPPDRQTGSADPVTSNNHQQTVSAVRHFAASATDIIRLGRQYSRGSTCTCPSIDSTSYIRATAHHQLQSALEAACAAYASLNLSLLHYITLLQTQFLTPLYTVFQTATINRNCYPQVSFWTLLFGQPELMYGSSSQNTCI